MLSRLKSVTPNNNRGQILVEYLLLMVIAVGIVALLTRSLVRRDEASPGLIIKAWDGILKSIGNDLPDCHKQTDFSRPNCPP